MQRGIQLLGVLALGVPLFVAMRSVDAADEPFSQSVIQPIDIDSCTTCCESVADLFASLEDVGENSDESEDTGVLSCSLSCGWQDLGKNCADLGDEFGELARLGCEVGRDFSLLGMTVRDGFNYRCFQGGLGVEKSARGELERKNPVIGSSDCDSCCLDAEEYDLNFTNSFDADACQNSCEEVEYCFSSEEHKERLGCAMGYDLRTLGILNLGPEHHLYCDGGLLVSQIVQSTSSPTSSGVTGSDTTDFLEENWIFLVAGGAGFATLIIVMVLVAMKQQGQLSFPVNDSKRQKMKFNVQELDHALDNLNNTSDGLSAFNMSLPRMGSSVFKRAFLNANRTHKDSTWFSRKFRSKRSHNRYDVSQNVRTFGELDSENFGHQRKNSSKSNYSNNSNISFNIPGPHVNNAKLAKRSYTFGTLGKSTDGNITGENSFKFPKKYSMVSNVSINAPVMENEKNEVVRRIKPAPHLKKPENADEIVANLSLKNDGSLLSLKTAHPEADEL